MLNNLIKEYTRVRVSYEIAGRDGTTEIIKVLNKIENHLSQNEWKCNPATIENDTWAMCVFFEMFFRKIGGDMSAMMCYHFSSLVAKDVNLPEKSQLEGNKYRSFIIFKNMDKWGRIFMTARLAPVAEYKGHLDEYSFFDVLLLGDVYKAWNVDPDSSMLANLKRQAPNVARNHPNITRQQAIKESELAHEAVFRIIESLVTIPQEI